MILVPIARSESTLLDEHATLNSDNPSQSYNLNLGGGESVSIALTVSGEGLVDFHILNSTDGQLLDRINVGTEGVQEQWNAPYSDTFEFIVELAAVSVVSEANISLKISSGGSNSQQPTANNGALVDQNITLYYYDQGQDFYLNLTAGEKISIRISATGSNVSLKIYNNTDRIFFKANFTTMNEEWTAPAQDTYDFFIYNLEGTAQTHITLTRSEGFDPTLPIIIAVAVVLVLLGALVVLRMRKGRPTVAQPPPPPPPPPEQ
jgi:hypothetical protein